MEWNDWAKGMKLQSAASLMNPDWQDVSGSETANRVTLPLGSGMEFFRLRSP